MTDSTDIMDTKTAAKYLGIAVQTLAVWRCRGGGPAYHRLSRTGRGGRIGYRRADLEQWLADHRAVNTSEEPALRNAAGAEG